jgi:hypothetical protein
MLVHSLYYFILCFSNNFLLASFLCRWLFCGWHKTTVAFVWQYWHNKELDNIFSSELFSHKVVLIVTVMFVLECYNTYAVNGAALWFRGLRPSGIWRLFPCNWFVESGQTSNSHRRLKMKALCVTKLRICEFGWFCYTCVHKLFTSHLLSNDIEIEIFWIITLPGVFECETWFVISTKE